MDSTTYLLVISSKSLYETACVCHEACCMSCTYTVAGEWTMDSGVVGHHSHMQHCWLAGYNKAIHVSMEGLCLLQASSVLSHDGCWTHYRRPQETDCSSP